MKSKGKNIIKLLIWGIILCLAYFLISLIVSKFTAIALVDSVFYVSMLFIIIGIILIMKGNPTGLSLKSLDSPQSAQYIANENLEVLRMERKSTNFYKNFKKHAVVESNSMSLVLIIGAVFAIASSVLFF